MVGGGTLGFECDDGQVKFRGAELGVRTKCHYPGKGKAAVSRKSSHKYSNGVTRRVFVKSSRPRVRA